jgi:deazaflavin-dependent oxidoreductase (nitroreductase family)
MAESTTLYGPRHVERYVATGGDEGHDWQRGTTILLLTTKGRKTGEERVMPLIYREIDGSPVIVASKGGTPEHPGWYLNLQADPNVKVQIKDDVFDATARTAEGEERERLWKLMNDVWPDYDQYQTKTDREIPVVVLERS